MPLFHLTSVRQKVFAGVLLTSVVGLLVSGVSLFLYDLHSYRESSAADLSVEAQLLGYVSTAALQFDDRAVAAQNLAFLKARPTIRAVALYTPRGAVFASYVRAGVSRGEIPPAAGPEGISINGGRIESYRRIVVNDEVVGTVYLAQDLELYKRIATYGGIAFAVMLAALLVSLYLSAWLQKSITRPIIAIADVARRVVEKRDYAVRANRTTRDEIGTLVDSFNEMLAEIQRRTSALELSSEEIGRLNKDLERRVRERTGQLEESNLQLRAASTAKSTFLSMMSHEIRTPMNGVFGMLELLSLTELDSHQRTTLEIVRESGRSLLRIIDDILDFSKIEAGKLEIRPEVASVAHVIANVVSIYSGNASSKALVLKPHVDPLISPAVFVDPMRLQQILNNLVSNAIKFTAQGSVEIKADLVGRRTGEDLVRFSVTDTGIGISSEAQAMLFQPFAQASGEITRVYGGTGLGLSIGQRLATLMGGSIEIASQLGRGTTVNLTLPLPVADPGSLPELDHHDERAAIEATIAARRPPPTVEQAEQDGNLVLVVDDHPINRLVLMRQATVLGYANEAASDGVEALAMWRSGRFRLVLTDCNMPEMDGYELARTIRIVERATGRPRTLIIACTANALKGEAENCFAAGMDDYIAKPVELTTLLGKLDKWLPLAQGDAPVQEKPGEPAASNDDNANDCLIDRAVLVEITGGDAKFEREVFRQFLMVNQEDVALLARALESRDLSLVTHAVHRIKGASKTIGATALADACANLEAAARSNDWRTVMALERPFHREASRLNEFLAKSADATGGHAAFRGTKPG